MPSGAEFFLSASTIEDLKSYKKEGLESRIHKHGLMMNRVLQTLQRIPTVATNDSEITETQSDPEGSWSDNPRNSLLMETMDPQM